MQKNTGVSKTTNDIIFTFSQMIEYRSRFKEKYSPLLVLLSYSFYFLFDWHTFPQGRFLQPRCLWFTNRVAVHEHKYI